jgi:5-methyltetrahydrofolate--homocysteine methyltransferase
MLQEVEKFILEGNIKEIKNAIIKTLEENISANEIFETMNNSIKLVGDRFGREEMFLPELMASSQAMKDGTEILKPKLAQQKNNIKKLGKVIIGTNQGDIHDIGKALIILMMENSGFEVIDLGVDVSSERFIEETKKNKPSIIGMSALLTSTMMGQKEVIEKLEKENLRNSLKVLVGGAPVTSEWADEIGADGYGAEANQAVIIAKSVLGVKE